MRDKILDNLNKVIVDIEFYKSKKDITRFIVRLNNILDDNKSDSFVEIFKEIINKIESSDIEDNQLEMIEKVLYGFLLRNEKSYIKKTIDDGNTIYEFKGHYSIYVKNKQTDIKKLIKDNFSGKKLLVVKLDSTK
jgi:hypothetical protein